MKLTKFKVNDFKRIKELELEFAKNGDNITVLAGQNESGKSTVLEALETFYQEGFSDDSVWLLKDAHKDKQKTEFHFDVEDVDKAGFVKRIAKKLSLTPESATYLTTRLQSSPILNKIVFYLDASTENVGAFLDDTFLTNLRGFINATLNDFDNDDQEIKQTVVATEAESDEDDVEAEEIEPKVYATEANDVDITSALYASAPSFVLFTDSKCDLLPDHIKLSEYIADKGDGINAVKNLEKILGVSFKDIAEKQTRERNPELDKLNSGLSANFEQVFKQRVHNENKVKIICYVEAMSAALASKTEDIGEDFVYFSVETKDGEPLPLRLRSKGLVWFLSFWLILESMKDRKRLILIDEPDNSLHVNAQGDLLTVLENIAQQYGHQIVYATHSPFLIPIDKPHRIKLVYNDADNGVAIDEITSAAMTKSKEEALLPIYYAIGCDVAKNNGIFTQQNVIVEGVSDMYAFRAMELLLTKKSETHFLPGVGTKGDKINGLISLCTGYGLNWCLVMDNDRSDIEEGTGLTYPERKYQLLKDNFFAGDEDMVSKRVKILSQGTLEDLFTVGDIEHIASVTGYKLAPKPTKKNNEAYIGIPRKGLFWRMFLSSVTSKKIKLDGLSKESKDNFTELLSFISDCFKQPE